MRQLGRVGAEREATLPREFYMGAGALTPEHLHSLSFQILQIARLQPRRVLEVGIGNGFVSTYLRQMGIEVVTADINPALAPDVCAPLHELPERLAGQRFDVVSCCEVLEHRSSSSTATCARWQGWARTPSFRCPGIGYGPGWRGGWVSITASSICAWACAFPIAGA